MWHWLQHFMGVDNGSGRWYLFHSGFGANLGELALLGGIYGLWRKHNCHTPRCPRIGRHIIDGTPWCNKHHQQAREK